MKNFRDPHATNGESILGGDAYCVVLLIERHLRLLVHFHDRVSCSVDEGRAVERFVVTIG